MKIKRILSSHRNDYTATMECEHCGATTKDGCGYNDAFYHERVIPGMHCPECGKNRAGEIKGVSALPAVRDADPRQPLGVPASSDSNA